MLLMEVLPCCMCDMVLGASLPCSSDSATGCGFGQVERDGREDLISRLASCSGCDLFFFKHEARLLCEQTDEALEGLSKGGSKYSPKGILLP